MSCFPTGMQTTGRETPPKAKAGASPTADVPLARGGALASDGNDIIYALRGDDTKEIWRYQISKKEWAPGPDIPRQYSFQE